MRLVVPVLAAMLLAGCLSFGTGYGDLKPGATRAEVLKAMHDCPNASTKSGRYEAISYNAKMPTFLQWHPENYVFILKDDRLVEFGAGTFTSATEGGEGVLKFSPSADAGDAATPAPTQVASACAS